MTHMFTAFINICIRTDISFEMYNFIAQISSAETDRALQLNSLSTKLGLESVVDF